MTAEGEVEFGEHMKFTLRNPVEALQWTGKNIVGMSSFLQCDVHAILPGRMKTSGHPQGDFEARVADWIIKEPDGKIQVLGPVDFDRKYQTIP